MHCFKWTGKTFPKLHTHLPLRGSSLALCVRSSAASSARPRLVLSRDPRNAQQGQHLSVRWMLPLRCAKHTRVAARQRYAVRVIASEAGGDRSDDRPNRVPRVRRVADEEFMVHDEELFQPDEWFDPAVYVQWIERVNVAAQDANVNFEASVSGEPSGGVSSLNLLSSLNPEPADPLKQLESCLWFDHEPDLDPEQLAELDRQADEYEIQRLIKKGVLKKRSDNSEGVKRLSTTFVRTWRKKMKGGREMVLRRSRLVARGSDGWRWIGPMCLHLRRTLRSRGLCPGCLRIISAISQSKTTRCLACTSEMHT